VTRSRPEFPASGEHELHVVGIFDAKGWIADNYIISLAQQRHSPDHSW
jgi:putative ABC transport system permease protein